VHQPFESAQNGLFAVIPQGEESHAARSPPRESRCGGIVTWPAKLQIPSENLDRTLLVLYMYSLLKEADMLALRLPSDIEKRLDALAKKTGRTKSFYAREAILRHIEDLEDYHVAQRRLARGGDRVTLEELEEAEADKSS
jgi:RHH-type rel operon transcriptional repressor/antitoxin RelB